MAYGFDPGMLSGRDSMYAMAADRPAQAPMSPQPANFGGGGFTPPAWNPEWLQANRNRFMRTPGQFRGARQQLPVQGYDGPTQQAYRATMQRTPQAWDAGVSFQGMPQPTMASQGAVQAPQAAPAAPGGPAIQPQLPQAPGGFQGAMGGTNFGPVEGPMRGGVPTYQDGRLSMQRPMYDPRVMAQGNYQNVDGFNMAPQAQAFQTQRMDLGQMMNAFGSQDISGRALDTGQTQQMNAAQALGTSLSNLNAAQVGSPEVQALLQQLAREAQYQQAYGQPMYQPQQYDSRVTSSGPPNSDYLGFLL